MYKTSSLVAKGTFKVELLNEDTQEQIAVSVYPPKLKTLKKLESIEDDNKDAITQMIEILSELLSRNAENNKISVGFLEEALDTDDMTQLLEDYFNWVEDIKKK